MKTHELVMKPTNKMQQIAQTAWDVAISLKNFASTSFPSSLLKLEESRGYYTRIYSNLNRHDFYKLRILLKLENYFDIIEALYMHRH